MIGSSHVQAEEKEWFQVDQEDDWDGGIYHISHCQQSLSPPTYTSPVQSTPAFFSRIFLVVEPQLAAYPGDITADQAGVMPLCWQAKILPRIWASRALQC